MTKSRGLVQRRLRSLPDLGAPAAERERWYPPKGDPDLDYKIDNRIPGVGRIVGHTQFDRDNRMTEFSLTAQIFFEGDWEDVIRVDSADGEVHVHYFHRTRSAERELIHVIHCQDDVDHGYVTADKMLIAKWSEHVSRWRGGR